MRQIVGGMLYDTDTAKKIYEAERLEWHEFGAGAISEGLYQTPRGNLFIVTETPAFSVIPSQVKPVFHREAGEWLERRNAPLDAFKAIGVEVEEA